MSGLRIKDKKISIMQIGFFSQCFSIIYYHLLDNARAPIYNIYIIVKR